MAAWLDTVADVLGAMAETIRRILWPQTFMALKVRLFGLMTLALIGKSVLDLSLEAKKAVESSSIVLRVAGIDLETVVVTALTLAFLVLANVVVFIRRERFNRELLDFARDPNVSDQLKTQVIEQLLAEQTRRF